MALIKNIKYTISIHLCDLFNLCLVHSSFPRKIKLVIIKLIYKGNDINKIINYRSLLPQIGNIFENIINNRMRYFIIKNKIINSNQYDLI